ncbi:MAG: cell surface protein SprA, partial [Bacteroidia bacterium]|nr:cell surface protein SprA [Bacteroidia bacterium]
ERGMYNYNGNTSDLNSNGTFVNPSRNWGGIMRRIETNDFEAANIDYIEIWMMDPFLNDGPGKNNDGQLYIELGNISEDIIPDRRKSFENGYPKDGDSTKVDITSFGSKVPLLPQINNAFDNDPASRPLQDVGIDGLNDDEERTNFAKYLDTLAKGFGTNSAIYQQASAHPSNDNYLHPRDDVYDAQEANIIDRHKKYNSMQGNSTLAKFDAAKGSTPKSSTTVPDNEDINNDFTMNQTEDYFQYKINLSKSDLVIGKGFVTDISTIQPVLPNGKKSDERWIQIKVPIKEYTRAVGNISDFKSIRFMRMYLKGFEDSIICRFAQIQMVRADWRRYLNSLNSPGAVVPVDPNDNTVFVVSTVNIEENGARAPVRYVPPPGIKREIDPTSPGAIQQNEQSLSLKVCNLKPGDARAAYKTTNLDIRNYKNIKMFTHAEGADIKDGELKAFIRIGTDLVSNYYEYEIPLTITPGGATTDTRIWPSENEINFELEEFYNAKQKRSEQGVPQNRPFTLNLDNGRRVTVIGLPDLSNCRVVMLGVRNPTDVSKCGEVWFNELRVTDISNGGGWAANARMVAQMADFATVSASGNIRTIGYGGVDKKLNERSLTNNYQYDLASNFELGKFFPRRTGVSVPMFVGWNEIFITPKYNPLNPDIELRTALNGKTIEEQKQIREAALDYTSRYSLNFTNVRKAHTGKGKILPWDISNFNATYTYLNIKKHNQQIQYSFAKTYHGSLGYQYSPVVKPLTPFKFVKGKAFGLIRDFNLYPAPQSITVRFDADRFYSESKNRNNDLFKQLTPVLYDKNFTLTRFYTVNYKITNNLKVDYVANVNARIQEPFGELNSEAKKDSVRKDFYSLGRMTAYTQTVNFNYQVPLDKIGILNWITLPIRYSGSFAWLQAPPAVSSFGNTIQNGREISVNGQFNLVGLYNKIPALRKINNAPRSNGRRPAATPSKDVNNKDGETKKKEKKGSGFGTGLLRGLMMVRNASATYTNKSNITLPGFGYNVDYFGQNFQHNAPGLPFILGSQDRNIRYKLADEGALTNDSKLTNNYIESNNKSISGTITIEPLRDFKINLTFDKSRQRDYSSTFRYDEVTKSWQDIAAVESGFFSITGIFWKTAFEKMGTPYASDAFTQFSNNRYGVSNRLRFEDERITNKTLNDTNGYPTGYGKTSQEVLIPAFIAAYQGKNITASSNLSPFIKIPLPSWRINYNGLSKIKALAKIFTNINLSHAYSGRYTVNGYKSNPSYDPKAAVPAKGDFVSQYNIPGVSIREMFSPLLGIDVTLKSGLTAKLLFNRSRNITLQVPNNGLAEQQMREITFGAGYRTNDLKLPFKIKG